MLRTAHWRRCAPLLLLGLCACGGLPESPKTGISVRIESPAQVTVGETYAIRAIVSNGGTKAARLDSIDIGDTYLAGVRLASSEPAWGDTFHVPIDNTVSHEFQATVPAGGSLTVTFEAAATQAGSHAGDFDICVNSAVNCFFEHIATEAH